MEAKIDIFLCEVFLFFDFLINFLGNQVVAVCVPFLPGGGRAAFCRLRSCLVQGRTASDHVVIGS